MTLKIASFQYKTAYTGWQAVEVTLNEDGSLTMQPIGYYEDTVTIPADTMRELGLVPKPDEP